MTKKEARCDACGETLEWLGSQRQKAKGASAVEIVHWSCPGCGRRWVQHSERGWRETNVDLDAE